MTTLTITINGNEVVGCSDATLATPEQERKIIAIIMAAMDTVVKTMGGNHDLERQVREVIAPTIEQRKAEACLTSNTRKGGGR